MLVPAFTPRMQARSSSYPLHNAAPALRAPSPSLLSRPLHASLAAQSKGPAPLPSPGTSVGMDGREVPPAVTTNSQAPADLDTDDSIACPAELLQRLGDSGVLECISRETRAQLRLLQNSNGNSVAVTGEPKARDHAKLHFRAWLDVNMRYLGLAPPVSSGDCLPPPLPPALLPVAPGSDCAQAKKFPVGFPPGMDFPDGLPPGLPPGLPVAGTPGTFPGFPPIFRPPAAPPTPLYGVGETSFQPAMSLGIQQVV